MIKTVKLEEKALLKQKGWMPFAVVILLQVIVVSASYFLQAS